MIEAVLSTETPVNFYKIHGFTFRRIVHFIVTAEITSKLIHNKLFSKV
jgi:hypothetical protein